MSTQTKGERLAEIAERSEGTATHALAEIRILRPDGGYAANVHRDLVATLETLERMTDQLRYAQQRDRGAL